MTRTGRARGRHRRAPPLPRRKRRRRPARLRASSRCSRSLRGSGQSQRLPRPIRGPTPCAWRWAAPRSRCRPASASRLWSGCWGSWSAGH